MIGIRFTFLLLVLFSSNIYSQVQQQTSEQNNKPQAYKFDEYRKITTKKLKFRLTNFVRKILLSNQMGNRLAGYVVVHAPNEKRANYREEVIIKFLRQSGVGFIDFVDVTTITFVALRSESEKTEFWIIPEGSNLPTFKEYIFKETKLF
jgi:hypothetical protein